MTHAVHFGAGAIGRGFIADLLHRSGYDITVLDVDRAVVDEIHRHRSFVLRRIDHDYAPYEIDRVDAVSSAEEPALAIAALLDADLITTSVWSNNLPRIAPLLARALLAREAAGKERINVIACENAMFASSMLRSAILEGGHGFSAERLDAVAAFPNAAVDRVVLLGEDRGRPTIDVADYFELALEKDALVDPGTMPITDATYTEDLRRYLVRKLYVVNAGHLWAGLSAKLHGISSVRDVFVSEELVAPVREAMMESAAYVREQYGFTAQEMNAYVAQSVRRYQAKGVDYGVDMVTRSPLRKLAPTDRLVGPAVGCELLGLPNHRLLEGVAMLLSLDLTGEPQGDELRQRVEHDGPGAALEIYSGITRGTRMHREVLSEYDRLQNLISSASADLRLR